MTDAAYPVDRDRWAVTFAHALFSLGLAFGPLFVAVRTSDPGGPLFDGLAAVLMPAYYLVALGVAVTPAVRSVLESDAPTPAEADPAVADLKRRYVDDDLTEPEFEDRLERELDDVDDPNRASGRHTPRAAVRDDGDSDSGHSAPDADRTRGSR